MLVYWLDARGVPFPEISDDSNSSRTRSRKRRRLYFGRFWQLKDFVANIYVIGHVLPFVCLLVCL